MKKYSNPKLEVVKLLDMDVLTGSVESSERPIITHPDGTPAIPLI